MLDFLRRRPWLEEPPRVWNRCSGLSLELVRRLQRREHPARLVVVVPRRRRLDFGRLVWIRKVGARRMCLRDVRGGWYTRHFARTFRRKGAGLQVLACHYVVQVGSLWADPTVRQFGRGAFVWKQA